MQKTPDDLDRIMDVMSRAFEPVWGEAWNRRQVSDSLIMPNIKYRLINPQGKHPSNTDIIAGFTLVRVAPDEEELLLIAVDPRFRNQGLGRALLLMIADDARQRGNRRIFLEMRANNPAQRLYTSLGFTPIGRRPDYYRAPEGQRIDAITFKMDI